MPGGFPAGLPLWPGGHRVGLPTSARLENRAEGGGPRQIPRSRCQRGAGLRDFVSQHYADITKAHHPPNQRVKVSRCRQSMRLRNMPEIFIGLRSLAITSAMQCEATIDYEQRRRTSLRLASPALRPFLELGARLSSRQHNADWDSAPIRRHASCCPRWTTAAGSGEPSHALILADAA